MVQEQRTMIDHTVSIFALRYAIGKEGMAMPVMNKFIQDHIHEIPNIDLQTMLEDLTDFYGRHTNDRYYLLSTELCCAIKRELYDE